MLQAYLTEEIALARKIFMYYTDRMYDYLSVGSDKYQKWYRDSLQLYFLLSFLENTRLESDTPYIGGFEMDETYLRNVFDKVREYYLVECEVSGEYGNPNEITITVPLYRDVFVTDWKYATVDITTNTTTVIPLPFTFANIDPESLSVTIDDSDPIPNTNDNEEGYHIINNNFYWNTGNYYNLDNGNKVHFQYKQIAGL